MVPKSKNDSSRGELVKEIEENLLYFMKQSLQELKSAESEQQKEKHKDSFDFFAKHCIKINKMSFGCIVWSLVFTSVEALDTFWNEYLLGHIKEMFEKDFITKQWLDDADLEAATLEIYVNEDDFKKCREELTGLFDISEWFRSIDCASFAGKSMRKDEKRFSSLTHFGYRAN